MQINWQPTASLETLRLRAAILNEIRVFFTRCGLLEVETPLLSQATVTDLHLHSFATHYDLDERKTANTLYLQTSPEFAMKRLLAAGYGAIFQICKAFRNGGEHGKLHNPEFTLLEWYRPAFDHHDLIKETDDLLQTILKTPPAEKISYGELFEKYLSIDPHECSARALKQKAIECGITELPDMDADNKDNWLFLLMSHIIEPQLGRASPVFVYDFPCSQAALAKIRQGRPAVAERFEVYYQGIELGNGFHELTNADEQRKRFLNELALRKQLGHPLVPMDERLIAALEKGMPDCAGMALGLDRLIMLAANKSAIAEVLSFPLEHA